VSARFRPPQQAVGADHILTSEITNDQMFAIGIVFVDVQSPLIRSFQSLIELEVKHLKPEPLGFFDLAWLRGDLDFKVGHSRKT